MSIWSTKTRGWHWTAPGGWEIIRDVDPHTERTRFGVWHGEKIIDFGVNLAMAKLTAESEMTREPLPRPRFPHKFSGNDAERQGVGDPGHCEDCCAVGHVVAHPDLGCGDVDCTASHGGV